MSNSDKDKNIAVEETNNSIIKQNDENTDNCTVGITDNGVKNDFENTILQSSEQKEKPVNLAGPSMASIAVSHMRRITGNTKRSLELRKESPLKVKYLKKGIKQRIAQLEEDFENEMQEEEIENNKNR